MFCRKCGKEIPTDSRFCVMCGTLVGDAAGGTSPPEPVSVPPAHTPFYGDSSAKPAAAPEASVVTQKPPLEWEDTSPAIPGEDKPPPGTDPGGVPAGSGGTIPPPAEEPGWAFAPPPPPFVADAIPSKSAKKGKGKRSTNETYKTRAHPAKVILVTFLVLILLAAGVALVYYLGAVKGYFQLPGWVPVLHSAVSEEEEQSSESSGGESQSPQKPEGPSDAPVEAPEEAVSGWPAFPHVSDAYHFAQEDDTHLYFLPQPNDAGAPLYIYRMEKDGSNLQTVVDLSFAEESLSALAPGVDTFAILGGDIYFSIGIETGRSAYFRVPKAGGETKLLFLQERSYITAHGGKLYFLFPKQKQLGVYDPARDALPQTTPLENLADRMSVQYPFSLVDGLLYYGAYSGNTASYYRMDPATGDTAVLLSGEALGDSIASPLWAGEIFYVKHGSTGTDSWLRVEEGDAQPSEILQAEVGSDEVMFVARMGDFFLFQNGTSYYWSPVDNPTDFSVRVSSGWQPFAVSDNWILFPDKLVSVEERANPVLLSQAGKDILGAFDEAYLAAVALSGENPGIYAAAPASAATPESDMLRVSGSGTAENLTELLRGDEEHPLIMAAWVMSALQKDSASGLEIMQGVSFLFSSGDAAALIEAQGAALPAELAKAIATELFGVLPDTLYDQARGGFVPGMAVENGSLAFQGWEMGESSVINVEITMSPLLQSDGTYLATLELEDASGSKSVCRVTLAKNASYEVFPYRFVQLTLR